MNKHLLFISFLMLSIVLGFQTNAQVICGSDQLLEEQLRSNPEFKKRMEAFEKVWQEKQEILLKTANRMVVTGTDTVYEIPVVFHVIHTGSAVGTHYNPSLAKIQGVVDYLNQVYGATYSGYPGVGSGGVNIPIRFVLAKRDPSCNATDGVNRINANSVLSGTNLTDYISYGVKRNTSGISDGTLKGIVQWNPSLYYNIWVVNKIDGWDGYVSGGGVVGYAQFAGGTASSDGTVIMEAFNTAGQSTLPHELGHAFNLYHTFQGGCLAPATNPCATTGDRVCDTEPQDQSFNCETGNTPCGTPWSPTIRNIMSYASCTDRFTIGQRERIKTALFVQRGSLIMSLGGVAPGAQATYSVPNALVGCTTPGTLHAGNTNDVGPAFVHVGDLQYYSSGYTGDGNQVYIDRTVATCNLEAAAPANMTIGVAYPVEIGTGFNPENVRIFIDLNNDGTFTSPGELLFSSNGLLGDSYRIHTGSITIPSTATVTTTTPLRMRVVSDYYGNSNPSSCGGNLQYGQAEDFSVFVSASPTPINLKSINAKIAPNNKSVNVTWDVAAETNVLQYEIESSLDGKNFTKIGQVNPKGSNASYLFNDANPTFNQVNFYRLKINESDHSSTYSAVVTAALNTKGKLSPNQLSIYPNPVENLITILAPNSGNFNVSIKNELGQEVFTHKALEINEGVSATLDLASSRLAAGVYNLVLTDINGVILSGKFVKK